MTRIAVAAVVASALVGFAPAPFRSPRDRRAELSLTACQGVWEVVRKETIGPSGKGSYTWGVTHIRIRGDRWTLLNRDGREAGSYTLIVGNGKDVAGIDWYPLDNKASSPLWGGLVKREGDRLLIMYSDGDRRGDRRQRTIESAPSGSFLITVRKSGR